MNRKERAMVAKAIIKLMVAGAMIASLYLIIGAVLTTPTVTITINWVKCLTGILMLTGAVILYALFSKGGKSE